MEVVAVGLTHSLVGRQGHHLEAHLLAHLQAPLVHLQWAAHLLRVPPVV